MSEIGGRKAVLVPHHDRPRLPDLHPLARPLPSGFMPAMMKALVAGRGPEWVLTEVAVPEPAPGEVLVRNRAAATNNADLPMLAAADPTAGGSGDEFIAGFEYAGEIAAVGDGVAGWNVGDPVMGSIPAAFAEYVTADARFVLPRPANLPPEQACALPTGLLTEHGALTVAGFHAGQCVLITGASTSMGLIGAQIAKALGAAHVIGTTRSPDKRDLLASVGVDTVVVTGEQDFVEVTERVTGGAGADIVLDHIAGQTFADSIRAVRPFGHVVNVGRLAGARTEIDLDELSYRNRHAHGVSFGFARAEQMAAVIAGLAPEVLPAVARGQIRPTIEHTVAVADFARGVQRLRSGNARGKVVFTFDPD